MNERKLHPLEAAALGVDPGSELASPKEAKIESLLPHLHDNRAPAHAVITEKPWHRTFAYMQLNGVPIKDCAQHFDVTPAYLSQLRKQEWFKRVCEQLAELHFGGDLFGVLEGAAFESVIVLQDLAIGAESESVRKAAASDLLATYLKHRKPKEAPKVDNPQQEYEQLSEELARLESTETNHKM